MLLKLHYICEWAVISNKHWTMSTELSTSNQNYYPRKTLPTYRKRPSLLLSKSKWCFLVELLQCPSRSLHCLVYHFLSEEACPNTIPIPVSPYVKSKQPFLSICCPPQKEPLLPPLTNPLQQTSPKGAKNSAGILSCNLVCSEGIFDAHTVCIGQEKFW